MRFHFMRMVAVALLASQALLGANKELATPRDAHLAWKPIPGAEEYEIELGTNSKLDPVLQTLNSKETNATIKLSAGTYYFRVRAWHKGQQPGAWSEVQGFVVNRRAPKQVKPDDGAKFSSAPNSELPFSWERGIESTRYAIEIRDKQGVVLRRSVDENQYNWRPSDSGIYQWRVGYESDSGIEWGTYRTFTIDISRASAPAMATEWTGGNCEKLDVNGFRLNSVWGVQNLQGKVFSGEVSWNPSCALSRNFKLRANLGVIPLRESDGNLTTGLEYTMLFSYIVKSSLAFFIEGGAGGQTWVGTNTYPVLNANIGVGKADSPVQFYLGYSLLLAPSLIHLFKAGLSFAFGAIR